MLWFLFPERNKKKERSLEEQENMKPEISDAYVTFYFALANVKFTGMQVHVAKNTMSSRMWHRLMKVHEQK